MKPYKSEYLETKKDLVQARYETRGLRRLMELKAKKEQYVSLGHRVARTAPLGQRGAAGVTGDYRGEGSGAEKPGQPYPVVHS